MNYKFTKDFKYLTSSYLSLNDLLKIFPYILVEKLIKIYKIPLFDIDEVSENGDLEIVKFLIYKGIKATSHTIFCASRYGHFDIVKYLIQLNIIIRAIKIVRLEPGGSCNEARHLYRLGE